MTPVTDRGEETRRRIIENAAEAFADRGYAATSLNDLVRASGLTKGAFYFHFDSKEALALDVFLSRHEAWGGRVALAIAEHDRAIDGLVAIMRTVAAMIEADPSSRCVGRLAEELAADPKLAPIVRRQFETWVDMSVQLLERAQTEGDARGDIDARGVSEVTVASFIGMEKVAAVHGMDLTAWTETYIGLLLDAVRPQQPAKT